MENVNNKKFDEAFKLQVVQKYNAGTSQADLRKEYGIPSASLHGWIQKYNGDCLSNYTSVAESLRGGLSLSLAGFGYWSHDIGGFESGCTPYIYKRWTQFGLLSSHSRYHGNEEYKVPWKYDEEAVRVTKFFTDLKLSLEPYFLKMATRANREGRPILRPIFYDFPKDISSYYIDCQYMLGDNIMVCPIFNDEGICTFYLPEGRWRNIIDGKILNGGIYNEIKYDYFNLPVLQKGESIICTKTKNKYILNCFDLKADKIYKQDIILQNYDTISIEVKNWDIISQSENMKNIDVEIFKH